LNTCDVVFADLLDCRIKLALAATCDENMCPFFHKPLCRGQTYAAASPVMTATFPSSLFIIF
jgi:hypothetical protein